MCANVLEVFEKILWISLVIKLATYRPSGMLNDEWESKSVAKRALMKILAILPIFFPAMLYLMMTRSSLNNASNYVETFFTEPAAENRPDSAFPLGNGRTSIE